MSRKMWAQSILVALLFAGLIDRTGLAQTTAFNYQGSLKDSGTPANGSFQMQFKLFDSPGGIGQIGSTVPDVPVTAAQGVFSVKLDFGAAPFGGADRWLEIAVRHNAGESYTTLSPREQIASSPYSVRTLSAASADNALSLGGVAASQYLQANASGQVVKSVNTLKDDVTLAAGSNVTITPAGNTLTIASTGSGGGSAILNQTALQSPANFNISGNGFVGGSVGVGTTSPSSKLTVAGIGYGLTHAFGAAPGAVTVGSYTNVVGGGFGTVFNHPLFFFTNNSVTNTGSPDMTLDTSGRFGIGTTSPTARLSVAGSGVFDAVGAARFDLFNTVAGSGFLQHVTNSGLWQIATTAGASKMVIDPSGRVGIGTATPAHQLGIAGGPPWTSSGWTGAISLPNVSAIGWGGNDAGNRFGIGQSTGGLYFFRTTDPLGTTGSLATYDLGISDAGNISIGGTLTVGLFPQGSSGGPELCSSGSFPTYAGTIVSCLVSSRRYKTDVQSFYTGLEAVKRLRPVTFRWKADGVFDLGLIAEEVAEVEPLLAVEDGKGEITGVKYRQLNMLLINALKEQDKEIEQLKEAIGQLKEAFGQLKDAFGRMK